MNGSRKSSWTAWKPAAAIDIVDVLFDSRTCVARFEFIFLLFFRLHKNRKQPKCWTESTMNSSARVKWMLAAGDGSEWYIASHGMRPELREKLCRRRFYVLMREGKKWFASKSSDCLRLWSFEAKNSCAQMHNDNADRIDIFSFLFRFFSWSDGCSGVFIIDDFNKIN